MALPFFDFQSTYLGGTLGEYLLFFTIIAAALVAGKIVTWFTKNVLRMFAGKTKTKVDDLLLYVLEGPILFTIFIIAFWYGQRFLSLNEAWTGYLANTTMILVTINVAWYLMRLVGAVIQHYVQPLTAKTKTDLDDHMLPILKKLVNWVIVAIAAIMIIEKMGYNVTSLVAGLGIGGLAFALAAQDLLSNLFGGIAILTDKPFKLGDRVKIGDVDGFVKEIGLRTTRIETFGGTIIVMPNSKVVDSVLENVTREKQRRMSMTIGVEYDTSTEKLEEAKKLIIANVKKVKGLDSKEYAVAFNEFAGSSLNIKVIYWITKEGLNDYFGVQDKLLFGIKRDFQNARIEMAFPTQTIHVRK